MYRLRADRTGDAVAAWIGGLVFGFSPFMSARAGEHFSLTLAAPLPIFGILMFRLYAAAVARQLACAAGATVAWAFLCDAYYAVYCLLIAALMAGYSMFSVERSRPTVRPIWPRAADRSRDPVPRRPDRRHAAPRRRPASTSFGIRVSFTRLYTPVLVLTLMVGVRVWITHPPARDHA